MTINVLDKFRSAVSAARASIRQLRDEIDEKARELKHTREALLPREDLERRLVEFVDRQRARWLEQHGRALIGVFGSVDQAPGIVLSRVDALDKVDFRLLCVLFPDQVQASLLEMTRAGAYAAGPSADERPGVVARLARELEGLEEHEEQLVNEAIEAGVDVKHRPETIQRRETEHARRENEGAAERARQERERIDREMPTPGIRGVRSSYIEHAVPIKQ